MRLHAEWGLHGVETLCGQVAALVVVDVLSFCTCVDIAVAAGAAILPFPSGDPEAAAAEAARQGAVPAGPRAAGGFSLSPVSLLGLAPGTRLLLPSPNGARLACAAGDAPVLAGCLRNAGAVAEAACRIASGGDIGVVPAGERWPDGSLRPAIEDLLGAGAILEALDGTPTPEARVLRAAFRAVRHELAAVIAGSVSGQELIGRGFAADVALASACNVSGAAPILTDGAFVAA